MIRILALSVLLALNFANGVSARPTPARRQFGFLPGLEGLSSLNPTNANPSTNSASNTNTNPASNSSPFANSFNGNTTPNPNPNPNPSNPGNFNTVQNTDNGVSDADPNPAAFLSKITGAATGGLNSGFNNKKRTAAKIPGFTGPSIEADVPSNLLPSVPAGTRRRGVQNVEQHGGFEEKRFIQNADFSEQPVEDESDVPKAVDVAADANVHAQTPEKRFIRNADYEEGGSPPSAANAVVAAASAAEGTSA
ncbi:unnamed protein product [Peniophora sp. CBMAI 1063]|nr:unnamed protein product [Peniophora sp. CBMAI 1063]